MGQGCVAKKIPPFPCAGIPERSFGGVIRKFINFLEIARTLTGNYFALCTREGIESHGPFHCESRRRQTGT